MTFVLVRLFLHCLFSCKVAVKIKKHFVIRYRLNYLFYPRVKLIISFFINVETNSDCLTSEMVKHQHPAAERNKEPILEALMRYILPDKEATLLEVSSGSGQHTVHFAPHFPKVTFQPTEFESSSLNSIKLYRKDSSLSNIKEPHMLDVRTPVDTWINGTLKPQSFDYIVNINMMHISEWACTKGLFKGSGYLLKAGGYLFTYGPYAVNGTITPESNVSFNAMLRERDPTWGLRDIERELKPLALTHNIHLVNQHDLPANNKFLVWQKK